MLDDLKDIMARSTPAGPVRSTGWNTILQYLDDYKHRTLTSTDYTRLLLLWPKSKGKEIQGQLLEVEFAALADPRYAFSALSYHWGGDDSPQKLIRLHQLDIAAAATGQNPLKGK